MIAISTRLGTPGLPGEVSVARKGRLRKLRKLLVLAGRRSWRRAARKGVAAAIEHRHVPFRHDFITVVDVGAHHGQFALLALEIFPRSTILSCASSRWGTRRLGSVRPSRRQDA